MQNDHVTTKTLTKSPTTLILGGLLVIAAFAIGSMWTKIQSLEGQSPTTVKAAEQFPSQPEAAAQPTQSAGDVPAVTDEDYIIGSRDADIVLVEYSDFECPFCKRFHPTMKQLREEYGDKIAWVYRHFPLSFHANAHKAAEAAECVGSLAGNDAFWKFTDLYFERTTSNGNGYPLSKLAELGAEAGANQQAVQTCIDNGDFAQKVDDQESGGQAAGVSGTPGTILISKDGETELISGALPYPQVKQVVEKYLN